jgi:mannose-1-phosphate guanylyltransferase
VMSNNYCVIMAGGIGSRFWPMSRNNFPKQFLDILGTGRSLLQQTYERFKGICPPENIFIVTNESYVEHVRSQLPQMNPDQILAEPQRRNTAPCIAYAAFKIRSINPEANMVVAPSDHIIRDEGGFTLAINKALNFTKENDSLLTLGIQPNRPDTGYGYIQFNDDENTEKFKISRVKTFTEKPNLEMAKFFLKSGDFLWNAGIFVWNIKAILNAFRQNLPEMYSIFDEGKNIFNTNEEADFVRKAYTQCTNISIDYGIMEKAKNVYVLSAEFGWSDLGTWRSLYEHVPHDEHSNAVVGNVMMENSTGCIINISKDRLAVIQGLHDFIVVQSENVLLICRKDDEQLVRTMVNDVKLKKGEKFV